jgi:hypothetical protein
VLLMILCAKTLPSFVMTRIRSPMSKGSEMLSALWGKTHLS